MAKQNSNRGGGMTTRRTAKAGTVEGPAGRRLERKAATAATKGKQAAKATTTRRTTTRTAKRTTKGARGEGAPARVSRTFESLRPIRNRQSRSEILATVAADVGIASGTVERVARSLSQTLTRHLIRGGSGRVEIPYLNASLWRGQQAAQKHRTMRSGILGNREVTIPARRAHPVPRIRVHSALREIVARR